MSITFVLPGQGTAPVGGFKVVYEYANALVRRGHRVCVIHPAFLDVGLTPIGYGKRTVRYIQRSMDGSYRPDRWFSVDSRVRLLWRPSLNARFIPDADVVVATSWRTARWVAAYPAAKGKKFYLIQHRETWDGPEDRVMATWRLPLRKIVIARWLQVIADEMDERSAYIPNGLDFHAFGTDTDPGQRNPNRVMMLHHYQEWKGSADGLRTLYLAHSQVPELEADLFGVPHAPKGLAPWIRYHRNPPQKQLRRLYNNASVFLAPSWSEGWGLTPSEAMMCGCAIAATDIGGHREFCIQGRTALLSPPGDPDAMAANLISLLQDQGQRVSIARSGNEYIQQFTWDRATDAFVAELGLS